MPVCLFPIYVKMAELIKVQMFCSNSIHKIKQKIRRNLKTIKNGSFQSNSLKVKLFNKKGRKMKQPKSSNPACVHSVIKHVPILIQIGTEQ